MSTISESVFQKDAKITICSDAKGDHPRRIGIVKRIGVGAWRLGGSSEWYNFNGERVFPVVTKQAGTFEGIVAGAQVGRPITTFARPYRDGDEAAIVVEDKRVEKYKALLRTQESAQRNIEYARKEIATDVARANREAENALTKRDNAVTHLRWAELELTKARNAQDNIANSTADKQKRIEESQKSIALVCEEITRFGIDW